MTPIRTLSCVEFAERKMASQSQSQSHAEDSRFTELLKPIKDLTQNFEVILGVQNNFYLFFVCIILNLG